LAPTLYPFVNTDPLSTFSGELHFERVLKGPSFYFLNVKTEVALILWSEGEEGRTLVAEFSFRYGHEQEKYSVEVARLALRLFHELQRMDWFNPEGRTKTQYAYRGG